MNSEPKRASKRRQMPESAARTAIREEIIAQLLRNEISLGKALKTLRLNVLAVNQQRYAEFVKISRKTLSDLENDKGNYSIEIVNQVLRPFELQVGILPINRALLRPKMIE